MEKIEEAASKVEEMDEEEVKVKEESEWVIIDIQDTISLDVDGEEECDPYSEVEVFRDGKLKGL